MNTAVTEARLKAFSEIVHQKEVDKNGILTLTQNTRRFRFCANCGHMLHPSVKGLNKHCDKDHGGQNLGFLVIGKSAIRPVYTNFEEFLKAKGVELIKVPGYEFQKIPDIPKDPETGDYRREDFQTNNDNMRRNKAFMRQYCGYKSSSSEGEEDDEMYGACGLGCVSIIETLKKQKKKEADRAEMQEYRCDFK